MDDVSFCWGLAVGFIIAGSLGFMLQRVRLARQRRTAANRTQAVMGQTAYTPRQVIRQARRAQLEIIVWVVGTLAVLACVVFLLLSEG